MNVKYLLLVDMSMLNGLIFSQSIACVDSSIGRLDYASLSQQTLMELLIEGIDNKVKICMRDAPGDISEWHKIQLNDRDEVTTIEWEIKNLTGTINLQWLPPSVRLISLDHNALSGSLDLSGLPQTLKTIYVGSNTFSGTISLETLPPSLETVDVADNQLTGTVCLTKLPETLKFLFLDRNSFFGPVDVTTLPESLETINISNNQLAGETNFSQLSPRLVYINVSNTNLSGTLVVESPIRASVNGSDVNLIIQEETNE